jgi:uncharacterized membrane protein
MQPRSDSSSNRLVVRTFIALSIIFGSLLVVIVPPFQVPDEPAHFFRAYAISEFRIFEMERDGHYGDFLPLSLKVLVEDASDNVPFHPENKVNIRKIISLFGMRLERSQRTFLSFPNASVNPPLAYLPQSLGILAGRVLNLPPLALMYLGRILNLIFWIACISAALQLTPSGKWPLFLIALMPMTLYQAASLSADAPAQALCFLFIAAVLKKSFPSGNPGRKSLAIIYLLAAFILMCKPVYFPLLLVFLIIPRREFSSNRNYLLNTTGYFAFCGLILSIWAALLIHTSFQGMAVSPMPGWRGLADWFRNAPAVFSATIRQDLIGRIEEFVGVLGWLDTHFSPLFIGSYWLALIAASVFHEESKQSLGFRRRVLLLITAFAGVLTILVVFLFLAVHFGYRTTGELRPLRGIQGRYFIPFSLVFFIGLQGYGLSKIAAQKIEKVLISFSLFALIFTVIIVAGRYYF